MADTFTLKVIARIKSDFTQKFGIPRQSSLGGGQLSTVVFEPEYRDANALRGIEGYSTCGSYGAFPWWNAGAGVQP